MEHDERLGWLRLALSSGIGPVFGRRLVEAAGGAAAVTRMAPETARRLLGARRAAGLTRPAPERCLRRLESLGQRLVTPVDPEWPSAAFERLAAPPLALFARGTLPSPEAPVVAIVGTREPGPYGRRMARQLAGELARRGVWILSGFALGIDGAAHAAALGAGRAGTVAVLGCGLDVPYPVEHLDLKDAILREGGLLSEYPPGVEPRPGHFPQRNRIVAALAQVVVVVEAPGRSGSLITATQALEAGREVLVVPGPVGPSFRGSHGLLRRQQAAVCEGAFDVLHHLGMEDATAPVPGAARRAPPPPGAPLAVFGVLEEGETVSQGEVCRRTGLSPEVAAAALTRLELEGFVARVPGVGIRRT